MGWLLIFFLNKIKANKEHTNYVDKYLKKSKSYKNNKHKDILDNFKTNTNSLGKIFTKNVNTAYSKQNSNHSIFGNIDILPLIKYLPIDQKLIFVLLILL